MLFAPPLSAGFAGSERFCGGVGVGVPDLGSWFFIAVARSRAQSRRVESGDRDATAS